MCPGWSDMVWWIRNCSTQAEWTLSQINACPVCLSGTRSFQSVLFWTQTSSTPAAKTSPASSEWVVFRTSAALVVLRQNPVEPLSTVLCPQVTASQLSPTSSQKTSILVLADSNQERNKWVGLLNELHRILKKNKLKERFVYVPKEAYDSTLPLIKTTQSAAIIGEASVTDLVLLIWSSSSDWSFYSLWPYTHQKMDKS